MADDISSVRGFLDHGVFPEFPGHGEEAQGREELLRHVEHPQSCVTLQHRGIPPTYYNM
jgi:hypothetical protein